MGRNLQDITGQHFGLWTVVGPYEIRNRHAYWYCRCDCGTEKWVRAGNLKSGVSTSCGCVKPNTVQNLAGQRFGLWTVIGPHEQRNGGTYWYCRCDCGTEKWVNAGSLINGSSKSCGCASPTAFQDLTGQRYGLWTVVGPYEIRNGHAYWYCRCDCGTEKWVRAGSLKGGNSISCGCVKSNTVQNLTGQRFGLWTVIGPHEQRNGVTYWYCRCDCGTEKWVRAGSLKGGNSISCGCVKPNTVQNLAGQRFGLWTVIGPHEQRNGVTYWYCRCDCGIEKWVYAGSLINGSSKSCGCAMPNALQNLTDQRFGLWTVIGPHERRNRGTYWYCRCDCGTEKWVNARSLTTGKSKSCCRKKIEE